MEQLAEFIVNHWILVTLFVILLWLVFSDGIQRKLGGVKQLAVAEAVRVVNQLKGRYIDVREKDEFEQEHIADSINTPLSALKDGLDSIKDKTRPVVLVCVSDRRARRAAKAFSQQGFQQIYVLSGGLDAWRQAKLPLFKS